MAPVSAHHRMPFGSFISDLPSAMRRPGPRPSVANVALISTGGPGLPHSPQFPAGVLRRRPGRGPRSASMCQRCMRSPPGAKSYDPSSAAALGDQRWPAVEGASKRRGDPPLAPRRRPASPPNSGQRGPWKHPETRRTGATRPKTGGSTVCGGIHVGVRGWKGLYGPLMEGRSASAGASRHGIGRDWRSGVILGPSRSSPAPGPAVDRSRRLPSGPFVGAL